jgi:hypothetical protein
MSIVVRMHHAPVQGRVQHGVRRHGVEAGRSIAPVDRRTGSRSKTASIRPIGGCRISSRSTRIAVLAGAFFHLVQQSLLG